MSQQFEKLKTLLRELFQLDQPDLDFGFYRVMHAKSAEVTRFLDEELLPQVKTAFATYQSADTATVRKELEEALAQAASLGADPDTLPKVKALRAKLATDTVDVAALEAEVYDHLYSFFRRYYSEGDFLSKRVYKPGVYAIPYEGEEVKLHWANADQYYIKTSEYLSDYAFRLAPESATDPMRVHFRLVDAVEGEHGNVKAAEGRQRVFALAAGDAVSEVEGEQGKELQIRFEFRPATVNDWPEAERQGKAKPPAQKELLTFAEVAALGSNTPELARWREALGKPHVKSDGTAADYSKLRGHLNRYAARNTFDYFIHKDLGGFLRRELDFYIKNEVMHLDDVEHETAPRVEQYLSKLKVVRRIAGKLIDFLAQLEDFQKKLWLKKKFVVETSWCIRVGCIPEEFYPEIAANESQRAEWVRLFAIDEIASNLTRTGYSTPLTAAFVEEHPTLVVDSRHFSREIVQRILGAFSDIDGFTDANVFQADNSHALKLMRARYAQRITCISIDPPYNTVNGDFSYKDNYKHSSWIAMASEGFLAVKPLAAKGAAVFATIDDNEVSSLLEVANSVFGQRRFRTNVVWQKKDTPANDALGFSSTHDYLVVIPVDDEFKRGLIPRTDKQKALYKNPDHDPRGPWTRTALVIKRFGCGSFG